MQKNKILVNEIFNNNKKISYVESFEIRAKAQAKNEKAIDMVIKK